MGGGGTAAERRAQKLQTDILSRNSYRSHATSRSYGADRESVHMVVSREKEWIESAQRQHGRRRVVWRQSEGLCGANCAVASAEDPTQATESLVTKQRTGMA